ncbi:galactonate dehydratase [Diplocloster agilis]|uniref:Galactonate dehydratase n=1 Tax=Diplocloster agilis TaxID=2850323 RepID=A0A949NH62_9FIRM|nr:MULTISPECIES: galactonate dehydratase [Lachnospiraceae]MBU9737748.1 galactonate dehydratase [Diplocloster agilis]MBU9743221.1 galactonate dehydratase [Diplocloster agilis]MCU6736614.1 galactonate dehydratase [Suonthocola fibrivorans]SCJ92222.1 D-galactonate dehydratase [uncultured Clostridium sp.]
MKIKEIELFKVPPRWLFLKVTTDEGIEGWGEPVIEGRADTVKACVEELKYYLIGKDPQRIEDIWQVLYRSGFYRGGPVLMSAISGIDQALWDIKGKYYQAPVYELMGGKCRENIKVYSWIGGDRPDDVAVQALERKKLGFTAVKMNATEELHYIDSYEKIDAVVERVAAIREAAGKYFGIGVDFHGRVHKPMAKILAKELEPYRLMFIEEPVLAENLEDLKEITKQSGIPIATGERMFSRWDYKKVLSSGYVDIIQPDLSHAGGITECKKIASMAEAYDVALAPHCPLGPIALAACIQLDATCANAVIQEQSIGIHYNKENDVLDYLKDPSVFRYKDGVVELPKAPGLGIEIDEEVVRRRAAEPFDWKNPVWRNADGTVAEW